MILTKELLEKRVNTLERQKDQMIAQANMCQGGIMAMRDLLSILDREESEGEDGEQAEDKSAPPTEE